jgi:glycosyltransferase involved in cell wall biosynthesis
LQTAARPSEADLAAVSSCIVANRPAAAMPRLLYDVTALAANDLRTGIERVTRSLLVALLENPPPGLRVEPVRATEQGYVHAFAYAKSTLNLAWCPQDGPVRVRDGDVLLNAEWTPDVLARQHDWIVAGQERGMSFIQMVFDLLPVQRPDLFPDGIGKLFGDWLTSASAIADGMVCISCATEAALRQWLDTRPPGRARALRIGVCNLGADIAASLPTRGLPPDADKVARTMAARPAFLMVGTVEPRKGHEQVLDAFEHLWAQGADVTLVVAGKPGWNTGHVIRRFETHAERGRRLLWLGPVSDELLDQLYQNSKALLAASVNEGFGLPLVEAARHGIPILARDIPVFREVAGPHASYFHADDPAALAQAIRRWLDDERQGTAPGSAGMTIRTWAQCASGIARMIQGNDWHHAWQASSVLEADMLEPAGVLS